MNDIAVLPHVLHFRPAAASDRGRCPGRGGMVEANGRSKKLVPLCGLMKPLRSGQPADNKIEEEENEQTNFLFAQCRSTRAARGKQRLCRVAHGRPRICLQRVASEDAEPRKTDYEPWKAELGNELAKLRGAVTFVGHSLGGSVLLKYLAEAPFRNPIAGMFLVSAPFWGGDPDWQHESFRLPKDFAKRIPHIPRIFLYHSVNDPIVPFAHHRLYAEELPHATIRTLKGSEHTFSRGLPELATDIQRLLLQRETTSGDYQ